MSKLPIVKFRILEKFLLRIGFKAVRQKGNHIFYRHSDGRTTTLPNHPARDLSRPLIREILKEIEITPEDFGKKLKEK